MLSHAECRKICFLCNFPVFNCQNPEIICLNDYESIKNISMGNSEILKPHPE